MTETDAVRERVIAHLLEASDQELEAAEVTAATRLREDLDLSSLQAVTLVMDLEDEFGITVEDEELEGLATVGDVFSLIERKQGGE